MLAFLAGKKVYLTALAGAVYGILIGTKIVPNELSVWAVIGSAHLAVWRSALAGLLLSSDATTEATPVAPVVDVAALKAAADALNAAMPK